MEQAIVADIKAEQVLFAANPLIALFEKKIQATLARVWGEDVPVAPVDGVMEAAAVADALSQ